VLGFACRELDVLPPENSDEATEQGLIWLGLVGMLDAPDQRCALLWHAAVAGAVHQLRAIATDLGISSGAYALSGQELERMPQS